LKFTYVAAENLIPVGLAEMAQEGQFFPRKVAEGEFLPCFSFK
jgi:hypothetical protein